MSKKVTLDDLLKPCPFDAGLAEFSAKSSAKFAYSVSCVVCMVRTPWFKTPELAMDCWNRRVNEKV